MEPSRSWKRIFFSCLVFWWLSIEYLVTARNIDRDVQYDSDESLEAESDRRSQRKKTLGQKLPERYDTAYECEEKTLKIECKENEIIHLIRANYGRFSITICNEHGNTDWSVNCMSTKSFRVLYSRCNQQQNCSIVASTSQFGDPCPNTLKYLEAHYQCVSATASSIPRSNPSWLISSQTTSLSSETVTSATEARFPSRFVTTDYNTFTVKHQNKEEATSISVLKDNIVLSYNKTRTPDEFPLQNKSIKTKSLEESSTNSNWSSENERKSSTDSILNKKSFSSSMDASKIEDQMQTDNGFQFNERKLLPVESKNFTCPPKVARKLTWNATHFGKVVIQNCPEGTHGLARWKCVKVNSTNKFEIGTKAYWYRGTPDLSGCRSVWLSTLEHRIKNGEIVLSVSSDLSQVTNNSRELYGGDMLVTTEILKNMAKRMAEDMENYQDPRQREVMIAELLQGAVTTGSNLLDKSQAASWKDLSYQEQMLVATSLLEGLEENAFLLANTLTVQKNIIHERTNLLMEVRVLEIKNLEKKFEIFPWKADRHNKWSKLENRIELTKNALQGNDNKDGLVRLVFMAFDGLERILQPQPYDYPFMIQEKFESSLYMSSSSSDSYHHKVLSIVNSKVISASLGKGKHIQLSEPVKVYFQHLTLKNVTNPRCVFWDYTISGWSEDGCILRKSNKTHTICECNHLTNFAVLMDVNTTSRAHQAALEIFIYIGCIISVVSSVFTIITFQLFRSFESDRTKIHKNVSFCLLFAEIIYIWINHQINQKVMFGIMAGILHFFILSSLGWICLEGLQLVISLIEVFEAQKCKFRWCYIAAYGAPLVSVTIINLKDTFSYDSKFYLCWLQDDNYFILSFLGPVIFVILVNLAFFFIAVFMMSKNADSMLSKESKDRFPVPSTSTWFGGSIVFVLLLGLTWLFGVLYLNQKSITIAYIFTLLNSLQGLFLVVFYCFENEKVWKECHQYIRLRLWLPKCVECSENLETSGFRSSSVANCNKDLGSLNILSNTTTIDTSQQFSTSASRNSTYFQTQTRKSNYQDSDKEESPHEINNSQLLRTRERRFLVELDVGCQATTSKRAISPFNHTYTEIHDQQRNRQRSHLYHQQHQDDPVYEEIEKNTSVYPSEITHTSDMSDDDVRRQSDMSRQSSRSYSDHRPLIPHSPGTEFPLTLEKLMRQTCAQLQQPELSENQRRPQDHTRTIAVLDGHTVVCHLQPQLELSSSRGLSPPSYSEC